MTHDDQYIAKLVEELVTHIDESEGEGMSSWAISFIDSLANKKVFTVKQALKVEEIHEDLVNKGAVI
jgi:hypothetical protein